tara:strand:+ start:8810 stop:9454 length:645 start_codon:yes stop_codon:yes gene_type:complete
MWRFILIFAFVHANMQSTILRTIEESVISHSYIQDAEYMCELVTSRLAYYGVDLDNKNDCLNAEIKSKYGKTIQYLYDKFNETDSNVLKTEYVKVRRKRKECVVYCPMEMLLGTYIEKWVHKQIPEVEINPCLKKRSINCSPISNITLGHFELQPFNECYNCLDEYEVVAHEYNSFYIEFKQLEANLNREIVLVWRLQMPGILAKKVNTPIIKF